MSKAEQKLGMENSISGRDVYVKSNTDSLIQQHNLPVVIFITTNFYLQNSIKL